MKDIEIRSDEVQEILGTPPKWIIRWGTGVIFFLLLLLVWASWVFKYPERVEAPIQITSSIPPTSIIAQTTGYIDRLFVKEGDIVKTGDLLGIIQNPTNYEDVIKLEAYLSSFDITSGDATLEIPVPVKNLTLSDVLQRAYSSFLQAYEGYELSIGSSAQVQIEGRLRRQIARLMESNKISEDRKKQTERRIDQLKELMSDKQDRYVRGLIPVSEVEKTSEQLEALRRVIDSYDIKINENELEMERLRSQIFDNVQRLKGENMSSYAALVESIKQVKSTIETWKQRYILIAQRDGLVTFYNSTEATKRYFNVGETVMTILPLEATLKTGDNRIIGEVLIPIEGSGKVEKGQIVKVNFDSYPAYEYGLVSGEVAQKSRLPREDRYIVNVHFPQGLITSKNKELSFDQQMTGKAIIITKEKRFIERIFERFIGIFRS